LGKTLVLSGTSIYNVGVNIARSIYPMSAAMLCSPQLVFSCSLLVIFIPDYVPVKN
jgi:hypothetical protein